MLGQLLFEMLLKGLVYSYIKMCRIYNTVVILLQTLGNRLIIFCHVIKSALNFK